MFSNSKSALIKVLLSVIPVRKILRNKSMPKNSKSMPRNSKSMPKMSKSMPKISKSMQKISKSVYLGIKS